MLRLKLLGGALLVDGDEPVRGAAARRHPLALMARVACADSRTVSRGKLVGLLWPEAPEERARNRLNTHLHRIRDELGGEVFASTGDGLRLDRDVLTCDVWDFEDALEAEARERAVDVYGGPLLDGFRPPDAPPFGKWLDAERERLARRHRTALEALAVEAGERDDPRVAARWWRRRAEEDPYDSRVVARLMEALAAAGNPAEALRIARAHERLLEEELELTPPDELRAVAERIKSSPPPAAIGSGAPGGSGPTESPEGRASGTGDAPAPAAGPGGPAPAEGRGAEAGARTPRDRSRRLAVGLAATLLAAAAAWYLTASGRQGPAGAGDRSVAVLPFEAIGAGDPGPIAEGLHNDLLTRLSSVSGLDVISATSVERFRDTDLPLPAVAESLGVEWIVEGDVQRSGGAIQVHAQLVDADTDVHAWADTYRRELTADNLFALQGEIAGRIAGALEAELGPRERERVERRPTGDLEAYRLYARGRGLLVRRTDASMRRAEELFRRATRRDSSFAEAWAALAKALVLYPQRRGRDADSVFPPGRDAARRALELDPDLSEAHMALAVVDYYRMRGPASLRRLRRALELDPSNAMAHHGMNLLHLVFGHPGEALEHARRAVALGPMSPENQTGLAIASLASGDPERGLRAARRAREIEPGYGGPFLESYALYRLGELPRPDPAGRLEIRSLLAMLAEATAGDTVPAREALRILEEERDLPPNRWTGLLQAALGRRAEALDTFQAAFRRKEEMTGGALTIALRYYYPDVLGPLRTDPRWRELIRQIDVGWGLNPDGSLPDSIAAGRSRPSSLMDGR